MSEKKTLNASGNMNNKQAISALRKNGGTIATVIAVALVGFFGWNYYQNNQLTAVDTIASDKFAQIQQKNQQLASQKVLAEITGNENDALLTQEKQINQEIDALVNEHSNSIYAWQGLMLKARHQIDNADSSAAIKTLEAARAMDLEDAGLKSITTLRLGEAMLANGDPDSALTVASSELPMSFEGSQQELLGDIYLAKDDKESAVRAYQNAWKLLTERQENRDVLSIKMDALGIEHDPIILEEIVAIEKITGLNTDKHASEKAVDSDGIENKQ